MICTFHLGLPQTGKYQIFTERFQSRLTYLSGLKTVFLPIPRFEVMGNIECEWVDLMEYCVVEEALEGIDPIMRVEVQEH